MIDQAKLMFCDRLTFHNYGPLPAEFSVTFTFQSDFEPLFAVRGLLGEQLGKLQPPYWQADTLHLRYDGADKVRRRVTIHLSPALQFTDGTTAYFPIALPPEQTQQIRVSLCVAESQEQERDATKNQMPPDFEDVKDRLQQSSDQYLERAPIIQSDSIVLNRVLERSLRDLHLLQTSLEGQKFFAAGVPWFVTLFGRDIIPRTGLSAWHWSDSHSWGSVSHSISPAIS